MNLTDLQLRDISTDDRRDICVECVGDLIRASASAPKRTALMRGLKARYGSVWDLRRTQWLRYVDFGLQEFAVESAANNPRDVDMQRLAMLRRHEGISETLTQAFFRLIPSDPDELMLAAGADGFRLDVETGVKVSRSVIEHDKLRASLLRLADYAPDVEAVTEESRARAHTLIVQHLVRMPDDQRNSLLAAVERGHQDAETDALSVIGEPE